jgi:hypothetical protein
MPNVDLTDKLALINNEHDLNNKKIETDEVMIFDPNFTLTNMAEGFRIFASEDSLTGVSARKSKLNEPDPPLLTIFLHASIENPGEFEPTIRLTIKAVTNTKENSEILSLSFDKPEIPVTFQSALLGGLLFVLQNTKRNVPMLVCSSSEFLLQILITQRQKWEANILDPKFHLIRAVFAALNERVARIQLKKVSLNKAKFLTSEQIRSIEIDTEIDLRFECPGVPLSQGFSVAVTR